MSVIVIESCLPGLIQMWIGENSNMIFPGIFKYRVWHSNIARYQIIMLCCSAACCIMSDIPTIGYLTIFPSRKHFLQFFASAVIFSTIRSILKTISQKYDKLTFKILWILDNFIITSYTSECICGSDYQTTWLYSYFPSQYKFQHKT